MINIVTVVWMISTVSATDSCHIPDTPLNTEAVLVNMTSLEYLCKPGHSLKDGNLTRYCINNTWTGASPICQETFTIIDAEPDNDQGCYPSSRIKCKLYSATQCAPPVAENKIQLNFSSDLNETSFQYGDVVEYICDSGHITLVGLSSGEATCAEDGQWRSNATLINFACYKVPAYVGCFDYQHPENIIHEENVTNYLQCRALCSVHETRFSMVSNSSCICHNEMFNRSSLVNDTQCDYFCPVQPFIGKAKCGGSSGEVGLFTTIGNNKCIQSTNLTDSESFAVSGVATRTCSQRCLGQLSKYAFANLNKSTCRCSSENFVNVTDAKNLYCSYSNEPNITYEKLLNLAVVEPLAESCDELYDLWKIRDSGDYLLIGQQNTTTCNFKDGTVCDVGWIGFQGSCYYFNPDLQNFTDAQQYCSHLDADFVSINSNNERNFIKQTISGFPEYKSIDTYFLGFADANEVNTYSWTDGALHTVSYFEVSDASTDDRSLLCSVIGHDGMYEKINCGEKHGFVCERPRVPTLCTEIRNSSATYEMSSPYMSLTMCIQICKGQVGTYALIQNDRCLCASEVNISASFPLINCNTTCPRNKFQDCGNTEQNLFTTKKVSNFQEANTCEDLAIHGVYGIRAKLSTGFQFCNDTGCPYSWVKSGSSCLKFVTQKASFDNAFVWCARHGGHLAVPNNVDENNVLSSALSNIPYLATGDKYTIGIKGTSSSSGIYRTVTGEQLPSFQQPIMNNDDKTFLGITADGSWRTFNKANEEYNFICEKSAVFKGCVTLNNNNNSTVSYVTNNDEMTVEFCVETCRSFMQRYALLKPTGCICTDVMPPPAESGDTCDESCTGSRGQVCGSSIYSTASAYSTDQYLLHKDCESLFDSGFRRSGLYSLINASAMCNFYENSTLCPTDWIAYRGNCYRFFQKSFSSTDEIVSECRKKSAFHVTILDEEMHKILIRYLEGSEYSAKDGIVLGLDDAWEMDTFIWPDGKLVLYNEPVGFGSPNKILHYNTLKQSTDYTKYSSSGHITTIAEGMICQLYINELFGCFINPYDIDAALLSPSIELTQCRQLCMGQYAEYVLINNTACHCVNDSSISIMNATDALNCTTSCLSDRQICGGDGLLSVYKLDYSDIAESCEDLPGSGVFYEAQYLVRKNNSITSKNCGFTDSSICKTGWLGHHGKCFRFLSVKSPTDSLCLDANGYLATPNTIEDVLFLQKAINGMRILNDMDHFRIFPFNRFHNNRYLTGDGHIMRDGFWDAESVRLATQTNFNKTTGNMTTLNNQDAVHICERSPGFIGCVRYPGNENVTFEYTMTHATSTQCIQLCMGQNALYAGVVENMCYCFKELFALDDEGVICSSCSGYPGQACGYVGANDAFVAMFDLNYYETDIMSSCEELHTYGVIEEGIYKLIFPGHITTTLTTCFNISSQYLPIPYANIEVGVSSSQSGFESSWLSITAFPEGDSNVWIPDQNTSSYILFTFASVHIITGISTQGRLSYQHKQWTTEYELLYRDEYGTMKLWITQFGSKIPGNTDRSGIVTHYLYPPIVTDLLELRPTNSSEKPSMHIDIIGQPFSAFDHSTTLVGWFYEEDTSALSIQTGLNLDSCFEACKGMSTNFYALKNATCYCSNQIGRYGKLPNSTENTDGQFALEYHRTYDMSCPVPPEVNNSITVYDFPHGAGVYTVTSAVTYNCHDGYGFPDRSQSKGIICQYNNTWSDTLDECSILNCSMDVTLLHGTLTATNVPFNNTITLNCNSGYGQPDGVSSKALLCTGDGNWNDTIGNCTVKQCPLPGHFENGQITGKTYTVNETLLFECMPHTHISPGIYNMSVTCNVDGAWDPALPDKCEVYECPDPPPLQYGIVERLSVTSARYTCKKYLSLSSGKTEENIICHPNMTWETLTFSCLINDSHLLQKQAEFGVKGQYERPDIGNILPLDHQCTSLFDCADLCLRTYDCVGYNFRKTGVICRLFATPSNSSGSFDGQWKYYELET